MKFLSEAPATPRSKGLLRSAFDDGAGWNIPARPELRHGHIGRPEFEIRYAGDSRPASPCTCRRKKTQPTLRSAPEQASAAFLRPCEPRACHGRPRRPTPSASPG